MTDPTPLTAEELDEKLELVQSGTPLLMATQVRLIAQAREEIRLREENRTLREACADLAGVIVANADSVPDVVLDAWGPVDHLLARLGDSDDPAARAKRELGVWLVSPDGQGFSVTIKDRGPTWISQERWRCVLRGHTSTFTRCEPTEHEAIAAALRAAKESGR